MENTRQPYYEVKDGALFEANVLGPEIDGGRDILFQGPRQSALWVCEALNVHAKNTNKTHATASESARGASRG